MSTQDIVLLLAAVLPAIIGIVGAICIPLGKAFMARLMDRVPSAQRAEAQAVIDSVVLAVEQQFAGAKGEAKKAEAVRVIKQLLADHRINLTDAEINTLIEATVGGMNQAVAAANAQALPAAPSARDLV